MIRFADGRVVFLGYPISDESPLAGISLKEVGDLRGMYRLVVTAITTFFAAGKFNDVN